MSIELVLGIGLALLIHAKPYGWQFLRASLIIPWAVPTIVNGTLWRWIYNADYGALNGLLYQLGIIEKYVPWLIEPWRAMNLVIIADVWHSVPFVALILQAALAALPLEIEEAAAVDGANAWQRLWRIRLPLLRSAILVALIIRTVEAFRVFDLLYVITQGGPAFGTVTISYPGWPFRSVSTRRIAQCAPTLDPAEPYISKLSGCLAAWRSHFGSGAHLRHHAAKFVHCCIIRHRDRAHCRFAGGLCTGAHGRALSFRLHDRHPGHPHDPRNLARDPALPSGRAVQPAEHARRADHHLSLLHCPLRSG
ncbi:MAG: sugar ABC transporter permease [Anaerolineales bacterium]|nr:sugar ABC transporter permease [Anaerolineales bacterium]